MEKETETHPLEIKVHLDDIHCPQNLQDSDSASRSFTDIQSPHASMNIGFLSPSTVNVTKVSEVTPRAENKRLVLVVYCGGTIGMKKNSETGAYEPAPSFLEHLLTTRPEFSDPGMPSIDVTSFDPPLDSSDLSFAHWSQISELLFENYKRYDGFVVLQGTDTMAYSASAVSFALENLGKPVVFTGSQIPLYMLRSDALRNLVDSLLVAAHSGVPEVMVVFAGEILRGNRTTKSSNWAITAFESFNYPRLGAGGLKLDVNPRRLLPMPTGETRLHSKFDSSVICLVVFPGIAAYIEGLARQSNVKGIVLEAYGSGNVPTSDVFLRAMSVANDLGVVVVILSTCQRGTVSLSIYATGLGLQQSGCISGYDLTREAAFTKLSNLLGRGLSPKEVKECMCRDICGELTEQTEFSLTKYQHRSIF